MVEPPPIILLTKKSTQEEGQKQDKPIEIEDAAAKEAKKDDKGKEKAPEEGHIMVQLKAGMSSLTPSSSKARAWWSSRRIPTTRTQATCL